MPELRQNLVTKQWVIIAPERSGRPREFRERTRPLTHELPSRKQDCCFCPGNEEQTMEELLRWPDARAGEWRARLFSNKYPALDRDGDRLYSFDGLTRRVSGVGYHEVLVESPRHNSTTGLQSPETICGALRLIQERGRQISADPRVEQVFYFKNHGPAAGTSIEHPHCQILALPMVPFRNRMRTEELRRTYDDLGRCPLCMMMEQELFEDVRLVSANDHFVAFVVYAAMSPFHTWIVPRRHGPTFLDQQMAELIALSEIMRDLFGRLYWALGDPDFNWVIRTAPQRDSSSAYLHWYVSVVPRITRAAGFELGSGMAVNHSLPEDDALRLRDQDPGTPLGDPEVEAARFPTRV